MMIIRFPWEDGSIGYDRTILISTSKIKNRIATKKNWNENGKCGGVMRLNPHSNRFLFSLYVCSFLLVVFININKITVKVIAVIMFKRFFIFYLSF
jgi:hypothetical protein